MTAYVQQKKRRAAWPLLTLGKNFMSWLLKRALYARTFLLLALSCEAAPCCIDKGNRGTSMDSVSIRIKTPYTGGHAKGRARRRTWTRRPVKRTYSMRKDTIVDRVMRFFRGMS